MAMVSVSYGGKEMKFALDTTTGSISQTALFQAFGIRFLQLECLDDGSYIHLSVGDIFKGLVEGKKYVAQTTVQVRPHSASTRPSSGSSEVSPPSNQAWRPVKSAAPRGRIGFSRRTSSNLDLGTDSTLPSIVTVSTAQPVVQPLQASLPPQQPPLQPLQPLQPPQSLPPQPMQQGEVQSSSDKDRRKESVDLEKAKAHMMRLVENNPEILTKSASAEMLGVGSCPRWVPDNQCDCCMYCQRKFAVMLRRHHCRKCGALLCGVCTGYKLDLPESLFTKPVRVCVLCYVNYMEGKMDSVFFEESGQRPALPTSSFGPMNKSGDQSNAGRRSTRPWVFSDKMKQTLGLVDMDGDSNESNSTPLAADPAMRARTAQQRMKLIREITLTEQVYADELRIIHDVFVMPLRVTGILSPQQMSILFSNIEQLEPIHRNFIKQLTDNITTKNGAIIGSIFKELTANMDAYAAYFANYPRSLSLLEKLNDNADFMRAVNECETNVRAKGQSLSTYLARPVQQAQRYPSLLFELISLTARVHKDYSLLVETSTKLKEVLKPLIQQKRRTEMQKQLKAFGEMIDGALEEDLATPTRELVSVIEIRAAEMHKNGQQFESVLIIFNDLILVCKEAPPQNSRPLLLLGYIPMSDARVILFAEAPETPHCFEIVYTVKDKGTPATFRFFAKTEQQKDSLVKLLKGLVRNCRKDLYTVGATSSPSSVVPEQVGQLVSPPVSPSHSMQNLLEVDDGLSSLVSQTKVIGRKETPTVNVQPLCQSRNTTTPEMYVIFATDSSIPIAMEFAPNTFGNALLGQSLQLVSRQYWQPSSKNKQTTPSWLLSSSII